MTLKSMLVCQPSKVRLTTRDGLLGAGVMLGGLALGSVLGVVARRAGWPMTGDALLSTAFLGSLTLSMPFWLTKGQPWKAQAVILGTTLAILAVSTVVASML